MSDMKNIWIIGGRDGYTIGDETVELLLEANDIGSKTSSFVSVLLFGAELDETVEEMSKRRMADRLYVFESKDYAGYQPETYLSALLKLAKESPPDLILLPGASMGRDLAPRLAFHLAGNLISNVQQVQFTPAGTVRVVKPVYGGKVNAVYFFTGNPPHIVTVIPGVIGVHKKRGAKTTEIVKIAGDNDRNEISNSAYRVEAFIKADPRTIDIRDADIVVACGRGVAEGESFKLLDEFAFQIGGALGCSRPVVDNGILGLERQIGQTGKSVSPDLFVSCGISGAMQHEMGMKDSKYIIAINWDADAPVFRISDYKIIADVNAVLPELVAAVSAHKAEAGK